MNPKEFIQHILINELNDIVERHAYLSFTLIAIGIEFIGKCNLTECQDWNRIKPDKAFKKGLEMLIAVDKRYELIDLKNELRNGLAHTLLPKSKIALSEVKNGALQFEKSQKGKTILVAEIFYRDFVRICLTTIRTDFPENDKMNKPFIYVGP